MKIYQLGNNILKLENDNLFLYSSAENFWQLLKKIPMKSEPIKFSMSNVDFDNKTFVNKKGHIVSMESNPCNDKLAWTKWLREETGCSLKEALQIAIQFQGDWR